MNIPTEVLAAIGGIAAEATWVEVVAANMAAQGLDESIEIAAKPGEAIKRARAAAEYMDVGLGSEVLDWVREADRLLRTARHPFVHGLVHYDENGSWLSLHMRTGEVNELHRDRLEELRGRIEAHAGLGWQLNWRVWNDRTPRE